MFVGVGEDDAVSILLPLGSLEAVVYGSSQSNSYYMALVIKLIAKEP